jgi:hypothetical protein
VRLSVKKGTLLVALLALGLGAAVLVGVGVALGTICALGLVFVLPGLAVVAYAPFPANRAERIALILALGVALLVLASILIDAIGLKLDTTSWVLALVGVSILGCGVALAIASPDARSGPLGPRPRRLPRVSPTKILAAVVVVAAIVAATLVTIDSKQAQDRKSQFTEVWTVPGSGPGGARIGIGNSEGGPRSYRVMVQADGRVIRDWGPVRLDSGGLWEQNFAAPAWVHRIHVVVAGTGEGRTVHRSTSLTVG